MDLLIDSHCHLDFRGLRDEQTAVIERAKEAGVALFINVESASTLESNQASVDLARREPLVFTVVGTHPHDSKDVTPELMASLRGFHTDVNVVAYGEAGLDYHYDNSPRDVQRDVFRQWIRAGHEDDMPLVIHTRDAEEDTLRLLREEGLGPAGAVIHCFTGSLGFAEACLELGCHISIPGIVTFKNPGDVPEVAKRVPSDRLLIETDSPFLTPVPHRGKRNEPAFVRYTAEKVAELRGVSLEELARTTVANTRKFFRLDEGGRGCSEE